VGPRNWLAKIYLRWLIAVSDDDELGFMLVRAVGPTKQTRSGHVREKGRFYLVNDFGMVNTYAQRPPHGLQILATAAADAAEARAAFLEKWRPSFTGR
jgi:hypothetical protein